MLIPQDLCDQLFAEQEKILEYLSVTSNLKVSASVDNTNKNVQASTIALLLRDYLAQIQGQHVSDDSNLILRFDGLDMRNKACTIFEMLRRGQVTDLRNPLVVRFLSSTAGQELSLQDAILMLLVTRSLQNLQIVGSKELVQAILDRILLSDGSLSQNSWFILVAIELIFDHEITKHALENFCERPVQHSFDMLAHLLERHTILKATWQQPDVLKSLIADTNFALSILKKSESQSVNLIRQYLSYWLIETYANHRCGRDETSLPAKFVLTNSQGVSKSLELYNRGDGFAYRIEPIAAQEKVILNGVTTICDLVSEVFSDWTKIRIVREPQPQQQCHSSKQILLGLIVLDEQDGSAYSLESNGRTGLTAVNLEATCNNVFSNPNASTILNSIARTLEVEKKKCNLTQQQFQLSQTINF